MRLALLLAMLAPLGCVHGSQYTMFNEAGDQQIEVSLYAQGTSFVAQITFANKAWNAPCPILPPDTVLTVNGKALPHTSLGTGGSVACVVPEWNDDDANDYLGESVEVKLTNSTGQVVARFVNVAVPRTFTIVQPQGTVVHPGQIVSVKLSPGTDVFDPYLGIVTATFDKVGATPPAYTWMDPEMGMGICGDGCADVNMITSDTGTFAVPSSAVGDISLHLGEIGEVGTSQCDVAYCDFNFIELTNEITLQVQ